MKILCLMMSRELKTYFCSMMGYIILTMFLFVNGYIFWFLASAYSDPQNNFSEPFTTFFFGTFFYWIILLLIPPLLTMRSIAEERKQGTLETLMTAPVTETQIILSKFFAALIFYSAMWSITSFYFYLISDHNAFNFPMILTSYLGTFLLSGVFLSCGIFASTLTNNQIIAAIISIGIGLLLFSIGFISYFVTSEPLKSVIEYINIMENLLRFTEGIVDSRPIVFFISTTILFLFLSIKVLDSQRWR